MGLRHWVIVLMFANCAVVAGGAGVRDSAHDIFATNSLTVIEPIEGRLFQFFHTKGGTVS